MIDPKSHKFKMLPIEERFWLQVKKTDSCWLWIGSTTGRYGTIGIGNKKAKSVHRFSYELHKGQIPDGLCVSHTCTEDLCVNPEHLILKTTKELNTELVVNRKPRGKKHYLCKECGNKFTTNGNHNLFCSRACFAAYKIANTVSIRVRRCINCNEVNKIAAYDMCDICYREWRKHNVRNYSGICPTCNTKFYSSDPKKFCSLTCYVNSEQLKEHGIQQFKKVAESKGIIWGERVEKECANCCNLFINVPSKGYVATCSRQCYREYMAKRFDRWIANPKGLSLPQCYDEFLASNELECLIEGCNWRGKHLGQHVNVTHGITADKFKEMAGFNVKTGLCTTAFSREMSDAAKARGLGTPDIFKFAPIPYPSPRRAIRLEGKEHMRKSHAMRKTQSN